MDVLSDVIAQLQLQGRLYCRSELSAPWSIALPAAPLAHFHVVDRGGCWLRLEGEPRPVALAAGDLVVLPHGRGHQLSDAPEAEPIPLAALLPPASRAANLGAVVSYERTAHGIAGRTPAAEFALEAWSPAVIRVVVTPNGTRRHAGYALVTDRPPDFTGFSVSAADSIVTLKTASVTAEVELRPDLRVTFKDAGGQVINEDLPGKELGITLVGDKVTVYKRLQADERFIGLGEQLGNLDRRATVVTLRNTDNYRYDDPKVPMYVSIPFFMGLHHGKAYGLFFNNSYRSVFNFGASNRRFASFAFDGGALDEFFIHDDSVAGILGHYTTLTGRMPMPQPVSIAF